MRSAVGQYKPRIGRTGQALCENGVVSVSALTAATYADVVLYVLHDVVHQMSCAGDQTSAVDTLAGGCFRRRCVWLVFGKFDLTSIVSVYYMRNKEFCLTLYIRKPVSTMYGQCMVCTTWPVRDQCGRCGQVVYTDRVIFSCHFAIYVNLIAQVLGLSLIHI